ncbi:SdrD B-like protein [Tamaricihabitans halophyticus]|uniref:SdrD B-like protein n=2 Tax=Tamaricihabitans halophyticus TaxID=1262583 RepID=A0A4R2R3S1_9PSEU|nr:SdrD B-like protein [Tamaricihabitans halophyticus]
MAMLTVVGVGATQAAPEADAAEALTVTDCVGDEQTIPGEEGAYDYVADYEAGKTVMLTTNTGKVNPFNGPDAENWGHVPLCGVQQGDDGEPVAEWMYCTDWGVNECGQKTFDGVQTNPKLDEQGEQRVAFVILNGDDSTPEGRAGINLDVWCAADGQEKGFVEGEEPTNGVVEYLENGEIQLSGDQRTCPDFAKDVDPYLGADEYTVDVQGPDGTVSAGEQAAFEITTNIATPLTIGLEGADEDSLEVCPSDDSGSTLDGNKLTVAGAEASSEGTAQLCTTRDSEGEVSVTASGNPPMRDTIQWNSAGENCQIFADFTETAAEPVSGQSTAQFTGTAPEGDYLIGDYVWTDANSNGIQDQGEAGRNDVAVTLRDCDGQELATTVTGQAPEGQEPANSDGNGYYLFDELGEGCYQVEFPTEGLTEMAAGDDVAADSDANVDSGLSEEVQLGPDNPEDLAVDAGYVSAPDDGGSNHAVGDYVWLDRNGDGTQDADEPGINGVTAVLYDCSDNKLAETTTAAGQNGDGYYLFDELAAGCYRVGFTLDNAETECAPSGFTTALATNNRENDSDADPYTQVTGDVELNADNAKDLTLDAGVVCAQGGVEETGLAQTGFGAAGFIGGGLALLGAGGAALYLTKRRKQLD